MISKLIRAYKVRKFRKYLERQSLIDRMKSRPLGNIGNENLFEYRCNTCGRPYE